MGTTPSTNPPYVKRVESELENRDAGCEVETLIQLCSDLTWNQIFFAIDDLSRSGRVRLTLGAGGRYHVHIRNGEDSPAVFPKASQSTVERLPCPPGYEHPSRVRRNQ